MDYKDILEDDERVIHISNLHYFVMSFPLVFATIFGTTFALGGYFIEEFRGVCYTLASVFGIYPFIVILLLLNTKWIITNKRIIEQAGIFKKNHLITDLTKVVDVSYCETNFGKVIGCGDIMLKIARDKKKPGHKFFKFIRSPKKFVEKLIEAKAVIS